MISTLKHIATVAALLFAASAPADNRHLNETLTVEGDFLPIVRMQQRIGISPTVADTPLPDTDLTIDARGVTTPVVPTADTIPAPGWQTTCATTLNRGYLQAGLGSYLNSTVSAGYRFLNTSVTRAGTWLQHNSSTQFKPSRYTDANRRRIDDNLGIYASHDLGSAGLLSADASWHGSWFNYYLDNDYERYPNQTLTDVAAHASWRSAQSLSPWQFSTTLAYRYFGYRTYYNYRDIWASQQFRPSRESHLSLAINGAYTLSRISSVGLDIDADLILYTRKEAGETSSRPLNNYGNLSFNPYYSLSNGTFTVRAAAKIDASLNNVSEFSSFHVAPDILAGYTSGRFSASLKASGGVMLNTLASLYPLDYYQSPQLLSIRPTYSPLDARLNLTFGSFSGLSAGVEVAYKIMKGVPTGGLYPFYIMATYYIPETTIPVWPGEYMNINGFSVGARASYDYRNLLSVSGSVAYQPQNGRHGYFNGFDRPRWIIDSRISLNPWSTLRFDLTYNYRGVRTLYSGSDRKHSVGGHTVIHKADKWCLPDAALLNAKIAYTFLNRYTLWCEAANLLGSNACLNPYMPTEGFTITGGFGIIF